MAGADRVEGTLFGNGERTGNVDLVTLAMNLFSLGVDPGSTSATSTPCAGWPSTATGCPSTPATRTSATWSTRRSPAATRTRSRRASTPSKRVEDDYEVWEVPYLPIDPKHVGRTYEAVIRVNSQSGKGGVAYIMKAEHGFDLPRRLQIEFSKTIQGITEDTGTEISPTDMWAAFESEYLMPDDLRLLSHETTTGERGAAVTAQLLVDGEHHTITGRGNGPIDAFVAGLRTDLGIGVEVVDYLEHAVGSGSDATAVAYVETQGDDGNVKWGVGVDESILTASLKAVLSAVGRHRRDVRVVARQEAGGP